MRRIVREPLVHFVGIAAALFVANTLLSGDQRELITVDIPTQDYLIQQQVDLLLRPLTEEEKNNAIEGFIEDEILVREARKRGFGDASRIRRLLIQNMRFFLGGDLAQPDDAELRAWFSANRERFESEASVTYDHVLFKDPDTVPEDLLGRLNAGADYTRVGDASLIGGSLRRYDTRRVAASFGPEEAPKVLAIDDASWHGPFFTPAGAHFLRVADKHPPLRPDFEQVEQWVSQEWMMVRNREILDRELAEMRKNYRIQVLAKDQQAE